MFNLKKNKLIGYESAYAGLIKKRKTLKNGWRFLLLKNGIAILFNGNLPDIVVGKVKKVFEAVDGKFMLVLKTGEKAIYDKNGKMLTLFDSFNELFFNGWYKKNGSVDGTFLTLYDAAGNLVGEHLRKAEVFKDGRYYMSVTALGNVTQAGLFNKDKFQILSCNSMDFKMLKNGWFIVDGSLYDNTGAFFIGLKDGFKFSSRYLTFIGSLMLEKHP